jgi:hypothetical protein
MLFIIFNDQCSIINIQPPTVTKVCTLKIDHYISIRAQCSSNLFVTENTYDVMQYNPQQELEDLQDGEWRMFSTSRNEISAMLEGLGGTVTIVDDKIICADYPFKPSVAFQKKIINPSDISGIDVQASPPTIRVGRELVFASAKDKHKLQSFAHKHHIPLERRDDIWDWVLEPFLDTEYTLETHERLNIRLAAYGLTRQQVHTIRTEVKIQMLKYNFDTMLWEWVSLGARDVLSAMRTQYDDEQFERFYREVMDIALLLRISNND